MDDDLVFESVVGLAGRLCSGVVTCMASTCPGPQPAAMLVARTRSSTTCEACRRRERTLG
jgi:hypothetical protein